MLIGCSLINYPFGGTPIHENPHIRSYVFFFQDSLYEMDDPSPSLTIYRIPVSTMAQMPHGAGIRYQHLPPKFVNVSQTCRWIYHHWLVVWNINFIFPYIGNLIIPIDFHIFQRGGPTTNQITMEHMGTWNDGYLRNKHGNWMDLTI